MSDIVDLVRAGSATAAVSKTAALLSNARAFLQSIPFGRFDRRRAGSPPEYALLENWLAHPSRAPGTRLVEDANHLAGPFSTVPAAAERPCDCFFVVDSCFTIAEASPFVKEWPSLARRWNLPVGHSEGPATEMLVAKVLEQMEMRTAAGASCFNRTCRIYAPVYRQVPVVGFAHLPGLGKFRNSALGSKIYKAAEAAQAFDLAYDDVRRAFVRFVDDPANGDRPFVLVGHSQGSLHLVRLLQEEVEPHPQRMRRFVHGYLAGWGVPMELFERSLRSIRPSRCATDLATVSSWRTAGTLHPSTDTFRPAAFYTGEGWRAVEGDLLTTNPVSWCAGPEAGASSAAEYRGALWPSASNLDPRFDHEEAGPVPSGVALRFGHRVAKHREPLGVRVEHLIEVKCGPIVAEADRDGFLRVPHLGDSSLFSLTERDWLLYHDLDCALFHNNLQENVARRVAAWRGPRSRL